MEILDTILGYASETPFDAALHDLEHAGRVEYLTVAPDDVARRRLRLKTDKGTDCAVALGREQQLADGAVLRMDDKSAIVVRLSEREWLRVHARDHAAALELGYFAGNLHWKVRFAGETLEVALEGPRQSYLDRLELMMADGRVSLAGQDG